ncbi:MAG: FAD-binding protein [Caldilineaceae bacterium]|nr:FAD-binding protein [Caldilineaceae bacterium]
MKTVKTTLDRSDFNGAQADTRDLVAALEKVIEGEVRFDGYTRMLYSTDASLYQIQPVGVVIPRRAEDVQAAIEIAARFDVPVLPRGGGSSLAGQAVGAALVIDTSKYMDRVLAIDKDERTVHVQPGMTVGALNRTLAPLGVMLGPDPASADRATLGGSVGNNATGSHSILYGMMADNVIETGVILADGSPARFGPVEPSALAARGRGDSLEAAIYRDVPQIVRNATGAILERWPRHWRRASGYNLDRLAAPLLPVNERSRLSFDSRFRPAIADPVRLDHFNLAQLMTGSEGTLAMITDLTLQLVPRPQKTGLAVVHFDRLLDACAAVPDVLETEPSAAELLDKMLMDLARVQPEWAKKLHFVESDPAAVLLVEFYGADESELRGKLAHLEDHLRRRGWRGTVIHLLESGLQNDVWSVRKAGLNILMSQRGDFKPVPGIEDVSVPPEGLHAYLGEILEFCREASEIPGVAVYAHASAGCLHVRPLVNIKTLGGVKMLQQMGEFACDVALRFGGTMSGEHGDGLARSALHPRLFGPELYEALRAVKGVFDGHGRMNPGKIVDAPPLTENLRYGPQYETIELRTVFDWGRDGGFAPAIEMCNGAGVCRKLDTGTMCPSYMATKDEHDTTRARANALRNALAGRIPQEQLFAPGTYDVMDLCLGCKACKSECPSAVDMAKIKAEYLVHYYRQNGLPLFNRLMGMLPQLNHLLYKLGRPLIPAVNAVLASPFFKEIQSRIGVHPERTLPLYAPERFSDWFYKKQAAEKAKGKNQKAKVADSNPVPSPQSPIPSPLILFHDTWHEYNYTATAKAAVTVLEAAGYAVYLAEGRACCGRPLITGGQADRAKPWVDTNVALLAPYAAQGIPIVGIEPSCILTLRDEYLTLASDPERTRVLAQNCYTFEEFVVREAATGGFAGIWREGPGDALLHGHCHQKALAGNEASVAALKHAGYAVKVIPSGCCGMAGDFGYEIDHYEVSRKIGEDRLLPAVRAAAPDTLIIASGVSCRQQISHFGERKAFHMAEALAAALRK